VKRKLTDEEVAQLEESWRHYVDYKCEYLKGTGITGDIPRR
jgi:hypothetical protein